MSNSSSAQGLVRRRGSVIIEFSLLLPLLVSLFLGTIFFGYDFYVYNKLEEVVRLGARYAAEQKCNCESEAGFTGVVPLTSAYATDVANYTVYASKTPGTGAKPLVEYLTTANIVVAAEYVNGGKPTYVSVAIRNYPLITPFGRVTLSKPLTVFPYMGN